MPSTDIETDERNIADQTYDYLEREHLLPDEQKGCRRKSRGTKGRLLIDKTILKDCKKRHTNLPMAWIDYKKTYDFVPHSWISECMEMYGIAGNVREFFSKKHCAVEVVLNFQCRGTWRCGC